MKDMSEEKDKCRCGREIYCNVCACDLIASLESRLKEAEKENNYNYNVKMMLQKELDELKHNALEYGKLCEANREHWEQRLSQAEAENKMLRDRLEIDNKCHYTATVVRGCFKYHREADELKARLSHLMDVVGKFKSALEKISKHCVGMACGDIAKLALAEWDGIKKGDAI